MLCSIRKSWYGVGLTSREFLTTLGLFVLVSKVLVDGKGQFFLLHGCKIFCCVCVGVVVVLVVLNVVSVLCMSGCVGEVDGDGGNGPKT